MTHGLRFELWRHGFLGKVQAHPLRRIQTLIRFRAADANAIERWMVLSDIRAFLEDDDGNL